MPRFKKRTIHLPYTFSTWEPLWQEEGDAVADFLTYSREVTSAYTIYTPLPQIPS